MATIAEGMEQAWTSYVLQNLEEPILRKIEFEAGWNAALDSVGLIDPEELMAEASDMVEGVDDSGVCHYYIPEQMCGLKDGIEEEDTDG